MLIVKIDLWGIIFNEIKELYSDQVCFIYDENGSAFDDIDSHQPSNPVKICIFRDLQEAEEIINNSDLNIVDNFSLMWVNGELDKSLIYKLRG